MKRYMRKLREEYAGDFIRALIPTLIILGVIMNGWIVCLTASALLKPKDEATRYQGKLELCEQIPMLKAEGVRPEEIEEARVRLITPKNAKSTSEYFDGFSHQYYVKYRGIEVIIDDNYANIIEKANTNNGVALIFLVACQTFATIVMAIGLSDKIYGKSLKRLRVAAHIYLYERGNERIMTS